MPRHLHLRPLAERLLGGRRLREASLRLPLWRGVLILCYHRIADATQSQFHPGLVSASVDEFEMQVKLLRRACHVIALDELPAAMTSSRRSVLITFDDGYRDNYTLAFPRLRAEGLPATFFLSTGYIDNPRVAWWDELAWMVSNSTQPSMSGGPWFDGAQSLAVGEREAALLRLDQVYKRLPAQRTEHFLNFCAETLGSGRCAATAASSLWMTWEMARDMRRAGMTFGGHTVNHPVLSSLDEASQEREIADSLRRIREELGDVAPAFAYPVGQPYTFDDRTRRCLVRCGLSGAFSLYGGQVRRDSDPYDLPRASVPRSADAFAAMLAMPRVLARW